MARYDEQPVPRGTSGRWEVVVADDGDLDRDDPEEPAERRLTALDVRAEHRVLQVLSDEDLASIPLVPEGRPLKRFAEYLDLHDPGRADFAAEGSEIVRPGQRIVSRKDVSKAVWEDLRAACAQITGRVSRRSA